MSYPHSTIAKEDRIEYFEALGSFALAPKMLRHYLKILKVKLNGIKDGIFTLKNEFYFTKIFFSFFILKSEGVCDFFFNC